VAVEETDPPAPAAPGGKKKSKATTTTTIPPADGDGRWFGVQLKDLPEGAHKLAFAVTDRGGHTSRQELPFVVDSTETFGSRPMVLGASGRDAKQLNQILIRKGLLEGEAATVFDERTAEAIKAFRKARGKEETALLDSEILPALVGHITIDISERKLYLYDEDKVVKTYRVAVGQPRYPTPTGDFRIVVKEYNPTWNPPPSPWAAGQDPVPPGPGTPLGTRWMGLSVYAIGIHGTYASGSIGTAASHGCIRMRIPEVEELFEMVYVGTPVSIVR
jgi:lipoprotein-anchoring transpeptidase ErfK/SrfK